MDRPRFQFDLWTVMLAVAGIAISFAIARTFGAMWAILALTPVTRLVFYAHVRGRCRAEGRPMTDADRANVRTLDIHVGIPVFLAVCFLLYCYFPLMVF